MPALSLLELHNNNIEELPEVPPPHTFCICICIRAPAVRACAHPQPALAVSPPVARSQNFFDLLPKVKKITLENNALKSLPPSVGGAKSLVSFNLNSNQIEELPAELARLPLEARTACRVLTDALALTLTLTLVPTLIRYSSCPTTS